jgi:hypothetical protein
MKDVTTNYAASDAPGGRLARLVRRGVVALAIAGIGAGAAFAQQPERGPRRDEAQMQQRDQRFVPPPQADQRFVPPPQGDPRYDQRAHELREEQRRQMQMQQEQNMRSEAQRRSGRLTPDERRDLRRQINEAGMDLYPHTQRR